MAPTNNTTLPSSLTIAYLKELKDTGSLDGLSFPKDDHEQLLEYLKDNGIHGINNNHNNNTKNENPSLEDCQAAVERMMHVRFWITHASLHPNYRRVKNWLWVHQRYREQIVHITTQKDFDKYHSKIEKHSEFEDNQLFKFFMDSGIQKEKLNVLIDQHGNLETYEAIQDGFCKSDEGCVKTLLDAYRQELLDHLKLEEETLVAPWLQLTDEEYKKYRSYLSWKYCVMY